MLMKLTLMSVCSNEKKIRTIIVKRIENFMLGLSCRIASTLGGRSVDGRSVDGGGGSGVLSLLGKNFSIVCWTCSPNGKDDSSVKVVLL